MEASIWDPAPESAGEIAMEVTPAPSANLVPPLEESEFYKQLLEAVCPDELRGIKCRTNDHCQHAFRLCEAFSKGTCTIAFLHDEFAHIKPNCIEFMRNGTCTRELCQFEHDNRDIRMGRNEYRNSLAAENDGRRINQMDAATFNSLEKIKQYVPLVHF
jgi:hypothetical protein